MKDDEERKVIKTRVLVGIGVLIYLVIAWSCILSLIIKLVDIVGITSSHDRIYFLIGFISGLLCSLMAIHKQDIENFIKGEVK